MLFGTPALLKLLWGLPLLVVVATVASRNRRARIRRWGDESLWRRLSPEASGAMRWLRRGAALAALALLLVAAARPQVGAQLVQVDRRGIDVVVALDVSLSMEATDVVPNRLERSRQEIRELFDGLRGDRMGVVLFSGSSFLLCPLTLDVTAGNLFLDAVDVDALPTPGTNLEAALDAARKAFGDEKEEGGRARAVVLFTDGEGHEGDPLSAARQLAEEGIPVLTVGVGTPSGEPIPVTDASGRRVSYKKDRSGNVVLSRLDEEILRKIAETTGGRYYPATLQGHEISETLEFLGKLEKGELGQAMRRRVEERFQIPLGIALVLLVLALATPEGRRLKETV